MRTVMKYPGAKNRLAKWIVSFIPDHKVYCEPFFGGGAVFFNKNSAYNSILNDLDDDVYNFFKVLREHGEELARLIKLTPYSREEYSKAYEFSSANDIEKARCFAVKCWQGFGCGNRYKNGFRRGIGETSPNPAKAWNLLPKTLLEAMEKLKEAQIEKKDAVELIQKLRGENTFVYIDPPYLHSTRNQRYLYNHEMSKEKHVELLEAILKSDCKIMISGYESNLYNTYLKGWRKEIKNTTAECSAKRTEVLWMNY